MSAGRWEQGKDGWAYRHSGDGVASEPVSESDKDQPTDLVTRQSDSRTHSSRLYDGSQRVTGTLVGEEKEVEAAGASSSAHVVTCTLCSRRKERDSLVPRPTLDELPPTLVRPVPVSEASVAA